MSAVETVLPFLPAWAGEKRQTVPDDMIGATILGIGSLASLDVEGGLVVDYIPAGAEEPKRIVFGFNDLGMWIERESPPCRA